ncbi:hypothetical protein ACHAXT_005879 [Thalassiosira profunda]
MPLAQLLQLLDEWNVRYAPNATRDELEALVTQHMNDQQSRTSSSSRAAGDAPPSASTATPTKADAQDSAKQRGKYGNVVDAVVLDEHHSSDEFDLPENQRRDGQIYDNGMQIFLMGFAEAGKTAAELALGSVADAVNPFAGREDEDGEWWYDEETGRRVLDADVLDFSPPPRERRRRRQSSDRGTAYDAMPRRRRYNDGAYYQTAVPPPRRRARDPYSSPTMQGYTGKNGEASVPSDAMPRDGTRQRRRRVEREGESRPVYSLYHGERSIDLETQDGSLDEQTEQYHQRRKQWKERLRHKFDAALGMQAPPPSSSEPSETYYDSWKSQMEEMDDGRKEVLRQQMNDVDETSGAKSGQPKPLQTDGSSVSPYPRNRRARMRASSHSGKQSSTPTPRGQSYNYRLDEVPFWREGGTIASLLFGNRPAAPPSPDDGVGRRPRRRSLEQYLLSPFGKHHTVTSLFLYVSRSALTAFGVLCRWAGVRGTVPQPIVATTVFAALISARRGQRVMLVALTVLALRLVGEVIHGSLYGNEFWEDERDPRTQGWKQRAR